MFGVLAIDKPAGWTSRDVVNRIQRLVRPEKVGHTGTLDPMATGVLLLAVGRATRLVEFSHDAAKSYEADFQLGCSSETLDSDSPVTCREDARAISEEEYLEEVAHWIGEIDQVPPKYSAVHVGGRRAHELARRGESFELPSRRVSIHSLRVVAFDYPKVTLAIECSSGTYIRSLGNDIARSLHSDAVMTRLVRTSIGSTSLKECSSIDELNTREQIEARICTPLRLVETMGMAVLRDSGSKQIRNGIAVAREQFVKPPQPETLSAERSGTSRELWAAVDTDGELVAILTQAGPRYRSLRVFQSV